MFFTREDILKIQNALLQLSVKDSELPSAEPVTYDDTLSIVQDGKNKQIKIEDFFNQISLWKREDFINITNKYDEHYISLIEAINLVPVLQRKDGLVITFQDVEDNWEIYQFRGNITEFFNIEKWFNLYDYRNNIIQSIVPDEEDLTASTLDKNKNSLVSLKDRVYDPTSFSGKGYKILRKNIQSVNIAVTKIKVEFSPSSDGILSFSINGKETQVSVSVSTDNTTVLVADKIASKLTETMTEYEVSKDASMITLIRKFGGSVTPSLFSASTTGVICTITDSTKQEPRNILTSTMMNHPNTIYEIRYDFDLNSEEITIPEGCVLDFQGGSFRNGRIVGNNTAIQTSLTKIFDLDIELSGNWNVPYAYPEWFGAKGDGITNDTNSIKKTIAYFNKIQLKRHYIISEKIVLHSGSFINGHGKAVIESDNSVLISKIFGTNREENCNSVTIKGISFVGHCSTSTDDESGLVAIELLKTTDILIDTCSFTGFNKNIELTECSNYVITDNIIYDAAKTHPNNINGYGVLLESCPFGVIKNNKMNSIQRHCIYVNGGHDIVIKNNYLEIESDYTSGYEGVIKVISRNIVISDNHMIGGVYGVGFDRGFGNIYTKLYNINIYNNIIENGHVSGSLVSSSITFNISSPNNLVEYKDIKISNNIFIGNENVSTSNYGAVIFEKNAPYENIIIDKNIARGFLSNVRAPFNFKTSGTFVLTNNIVIDSTKSYQFESNDTRIIGKNNSYQNSGSPSGSFLNTREYNLEPIFNISTGHDWKYIKDNTIDATIDNCFVYSNSSNPAVITQIQGGFRGQVIHIICSAIGAIRLVNGELIKLKDGIDFYPDTDSISIISLINNGAKWMELNRCYYSSNKNYGPWTAKPINKSLGTHYFCTDKQTPEQAAISADLKGIDIIFKGQDTTDPDHPKDIWVDALGRVIS